MEFSNEDLNKKIFIRYNLGKKLNENEEEINDNVLLEVTTLENVEEVGQMVTQIQDGTFKPLNTLKIANEYVDDVFLIINVTKTKNLVVAPLSPDFNVSKFITNYVQNNVAEIPKRALKFIMEEKVQTEEYEMAAILRDEIFKRDGNATKVSE